MRTIQHVIAGTETTGASTRFGPVYAILDHTGIATVSFVGSTPIARYVAPAGLGQRQARAGPRRREEPRRRAPRLGMRLRYNYLLYPTPGQAQALAGCSAASEWFYNDGWHTRKHAYEGGLPYVTDAELSARLAAANATPGRAWLGGVSAVPLQQSLADLKPKPIADRTCRYLRGVNIGGEQR